MNSAPIFVDARRLSGWLLSHFDHRQDSLLARRLSTTALDLLRAVTLALKNSAREDQIERADEELISLRIELRLAEEIGLLSEEQVLFALREADSIGRQLGGWSRSLGAL